MIAFSPILLLFNTDLFRDEKLLSKLFMLFRWVLVDVFAVLGVVGLGVLGFRLTNC
jgi:hypothetical protein